MLSEHLHGFSLDLVERKSNRQITIPYATETGKSRLKTEKTISELLSSYSIEGRMEYCSLGGPRLIKSSGAW